MLDRKLFHWKVTLIGVEDKQSYDATLSAYWSPERDEAPEWVGSAAAVQAWYRNLKGDGGRRKSQLFKAIEVVLVPS